MTHLPYPLPRASSLVSDVQSKDLSRAVGLAIALKHVAAAPENQTSTRRTQAYLSVVEDLRRQAMGRSDLGVQDD